MLKNLIIEVSGVSHCNKKIVRGTITNAKEQVRILHDGKETVNYDR
jgi:hypothetical protein